MEHRLFVRNNVQEPRSVAELRAALDDARKTMDTNEETLGSVLKQIRQELLTHRSEEARAVRREASRAHAALAAQQCDWAELLSLSGAADREDLGWASDVEALTVALLIEQEEKEAGGGGGGREAELCVALSRCDVSVARVVVALTGGNYCAVKRRKEEFGIGCEDACVAQLLRLTFEAARSRARRRFDKCFKGPHRLQTE